MSCDTSLLVGIACVKDFTGTSGQCGIKLPEDGAVLSPWVKLTFQTNGKRSIITVGNRSQPLEEGGDDCSTAVIKSFTFGSSDGQEARVEIHDQKGSSFSQFMHNLLKDMACANPDKAEFITAIVEFGWIKTRCNGPLPRNHSCKYQLWPKTVKTNFAEGKFMYELTLVDMGKIIVDQHKSNAVIGDDAENRTYLTNAVRTLLTEGSPSVKTVAFLKDGAAGDPETPVKFRDGDDMEKELGPRRTWHMKKQDKLNAANEMVGKYLTADDKSLKPYYDSCHEGGRIVFREDSKPKPCDILSDDDIAKRCIGTYIVNGGKYSPVLEFNPQVDWAFWQMPTGGNAGDMNVAGGLEKGQHSGVNNTTGEGCQRIDKNGNPYTLKKPDSVPGTGAETSVGPDSDIEERHGKNANKEVAMAQAEQMRANPLMYQSFSADLKIIGDPSISPFYSLSKLVSIIFINPFHHHNDGSDCGEWISEPPCNEVLTNRGYIVNSVTHNISDGGYTTTLGLSLPMPGVELSIGNYAGADPKAWSPRSLC